MDACFWKKSGKFQWIFCATDNCSLEGLTEKLNANEIGYSYDANIINLGVKKINGKLYSSNFVGVCRLKNVNGRNIKTPDGCEVILKIVPRFDISVTEMLNKLREDDEFERYLAPQTNRLNESSREIQDLNNNELFRFYNDEEPIFLDDNIAQDSSIIATTVFITLLKNLCSRPLMGKMVTREENLTGKVKGKIVYGKNIQKNTLRGRDDRMYCRYLEYTEDIMENRILKAALHKAEIFLNKYFGSISGCKNSIRDMMLYCKNALSHVTETRITRMDLNNIKVTGIYVYYKPVINAAKMVLNEITVEATGSSAITSYVIPYAVSMEKLFEMYVRAFLKKSGIKSYFSKEKGIHLAKYDEKIPVLNQKIYGYSNYIAGNVKPDIIIFNSENEKYAVFDVKYKNENSSKSSRADRLQIMAYALMFNCTDVGNIFPAQNLRFNNFYKRNELHSFEDRKRYYNQINISIDASEEYMLYDADGSKAFSVYDYFYSMLK